MCNYLWTIFYIRCMEEHDINDQILLYLYKFRNDSDFHDLFDYFEQNQYDVVFDKANDLYTEKRLDIQPEFSFGNGPPKLKHDFFAQITPSGIEYVKNDIIRQLEIDTLRKQNEKANKKRHRTNVVISIFGVLVLIYSVYQVDRTSTLTQELQKVSKERDSLSTVTVDQYNLLKTKDKEIIKTKITLDSLVDSLKADKQTKRK